MTIRPAYHMWPLYDARLREVIGCMTEEQLALRPAPDRWPIWGTVGHTACQLSLTLGMLGLPQIDPWDQV